MKVNFGKHTGKSVELLLLKEPDYVQWVLEQSSPTGALAQVKAEMLRLINKFDAKPFQTRCWTQQLPSHQATKCTVYGNNVTSPYWWCDSCDPYQSGAFRGKLQGVSTYEDALRHVEHFCGGRVSDYRSLIRSLANAKGLPSRVGEKQAAAFFV